MHSWARKARLDLPDQWQEIQAALPRQKPMLAGEGAGQAAGPEKSGRKRLSFAITVLAAFGLLAALFLPGLLFRRPDPVTPGTHYTHAGNGAPTSGGPEEASSATHSASQLAFSERANAQFDLLEEARIPDLYAAYGGCYIEDLQLLVINVTSSPEDFEDQHADLLDFSIIEVRQVKYTLKELETAYEQLYENLPGPEELSRLGVYGMGVFEEDNAIKLVVKKVTDEIRQIVAANLADTGMVVFELDGKIIPY